MGSALLMLGMGWLRMAFLVATAESPGGAGLHGGLTLLILRGNCPILGGAPWGRTRPDMLRTVSAYVIGLNPACCPWRSSRGSVGGLCCAVAVGGGLA